MRFEDFKVGNYFWTKAGKWYCLDRGSDCIIACRVKPYKRTSYRTEINDDGSFSRVGPPIEHSMSWDSILQGDEAWILATLSVISWMDIGGCYQSEPKLEPGEQFLWSEDRDLEHRNA